MLIFRASATCDKTHLCPRPHFESEGFWNSELEVAYCAF